MLSVIGSSWNRRLSFLPRSHAMPDEAAAHLGSSCAASACLHLCLSLLQPHVVYNSVDGASSPLGCSLICLVPWYILERAESDSWWVHALHPYHLPAPSRMIEAQVDAADIVLHCHLIFRSCVIARSGYSSAPVLNAPPPVLRLWDASSRSKFRVHFRTYSTLRIGTSSEASTSCSVMPGLPRYPQQGGRAAASRPRPGSRLDQGAPG